MIRIGRKPLLLALALVPAAAAQTPAVTFDVASIKPAATPERQPIFCLIPCMVGERYTLEGNRLEIRYLTLARLIATAYRVKEYQLAGPDFLHSERFDIDAKLPAGAAASRLPDMLQALLADRFHLAFHRESKDENVYALIAGKNGFKLQEAEPGATVALPAGSAAESLYTTGGGQARALPGRGGMVADGGPLGPLTMRHTDTAERIDLKRVTMAGLVELIAPHYDRPVVDLTGLTAAYAMQIDIEHPSARGEGGRKGAAANDEIGSADPFLDSLKRAYDRAGLRIESRKAPVEHLAIDRIDRAPTAN